MLYTHAVQQEIDEMLSGLISAEDEEEIMKELDDLREQEVKTHLKKGIQHKSS